MRTLLAILLALALGVPAAAAGKKLVMKDGSYQAVRTWEKKADRVRYYSIERNDWEEVPASLVDWAATEKANQADTEASGERAKEAAEIAKAGEREALGPEIAPGVHIPDNDGLFVIVNNKATALPKQQANARLDKGRLLTNVVIPVPILRNRSVVEIPGAQSALRLDSPPAALFANGKARDNSRYVIARLKTKGDKRQIGNISVNIIGRDPKHSGDYVQVQEEKVADGIWKLIPVTPLVAGEYAVLEFIGNDLNMFLWDFAVEKQ